MGQHNCHNWGERPFETALVHLLSVLIPGAVFILLLLALAFIRLRAAMKAPIKDRETSPAETKREHGLRLAVPAFASKKWSPGSYVTVVSVTLGLLMILASVVLTVSGYVSNPQLRDQYGVWRLDLYFALHPWVLAGLQIGCALVVFAVGLKATGLARMLSGPAGWWKLTLCLAAASLAVPNYVITQTVTVYGYLTTHLFTWIPFSVAYIPNAYDHSTILPECLFCGRPFFAWNWIQGFLALLFILSASSAYTLKSTGRMKMVMVLSALLLFTSLHLDYQIAPGWNAGSIIPAFTPFFFLFPFHEVLLALTGISALTLQPLRAEHRVEGSRPQIESSMMFCRECGAKIPRNSKFCKECGSKIV